MAGKGREFFCWDDGNFVNGSTPNTVTHSTIYSMHVNFTVYELYFNGAGQKRLPLFLEH